MPNAVRNTDGSVMVDGVRLTAAQVVAIGSARSPEPFRPILITTGGGKKYGQSGVPRYGIAYDKATGSFHWLDENWEPIHNGSWKTRNLNRMTLTFQKPSS
jgi:hypothetical protein